MTKQEAIEEIEKFRSLAHGHAVLAEALDMAIEALQRGLENVNADSCSEKPNRSEPLTDKEQQIFLAAMEREREVCKQVDEEWRNCREPYEDSLVMICNEIVRKVEGALWDGN